MTVYFETVSSEYLERALYLEAERLAFLPSALDQAKFDTEREVVKNERRQDFDNVPYGLVEETLLARVFPKGHPYSWSVIGSMKDLGAASLDDLRSFFAEFYHPANATLCLVGDFDPTRAKDLVARYFGPLSAGPRPSSVHAQPVAARSAYAELADEVKLPRIHWSWPTVADDHPDSPALDMLATVLAGGETSRLYQTLVRDLRLAKDVAADNDTKEIAGLLTLRATAAEGKTTADIESEFQKEIARLRAEPPRPAELARVLARLETELYTRLTRAIGTGNRDQHGVCPEGRSGVLPQGVRPLFQGHSGRHPARRLPLPHRRQGGPVGTPGQARRGQDRAGSGRPRSGFGQKSQGQHATARGRARLVKDARPHNAAGVSTSALRAPVALQRDRPLDLNLEDVASGPGVAHGPDWYRRRS